MLERIYRNTKKILEPFQDQGFVFVPIAIGQKKETVAKKVIQMKKYGVEFNVGYDTYSKIWNKYAQGSIPKNFLIDKKGLILYVSQGYSENSVDKLTAEIEKLLAE